MAKAITRPFVEQQLKNLNRMMDMPLQPYHCNDQGVIIPKLVTSTLTAHTVSTSCVA